ncbi:MAG: phosphohistidine phosphatase SixA [Planctomycetes bacterium SCN 63-9]|nr:MAG: phosphohistidine phosphatase SixA [Planctomycetes bacterium SCN 63-9]
MEKLYILRHGIALPHGTPGMADDDRPLTPEGEKRMREIGRSLARLRLDLDQIVTSPLPRARRTAEIVAEALDPALRQGLQDEPALRSGNGADMIRNWLRSRAEARLMIVGHNPSLSDLIGLLVLDDPNAMLGDLKKGGIASLAHDGNSGDRYQIEWIATPGLLRKLR